ncbi:MAG: hypothetical protein ACOYU3_03130 [Bacillota bacterium]
MDLISIILAFAAGVVGATVGAVQAFVFTGLVGLAGMGVDAAIVAAGGTGIPFIVGVPFGFWWHPMYAFFGAAVACGYARKMGYIESAKGAAGLALTGLKKPDVLLVSGIAAVIGRVCMLLLTDPAYIGLAIDGAAATIFVLSVLAKAIFDGGKIFGTVSEEIKGVGGRFGGHNYAAWLPWQRAGWQKVTISIGWALVSAAGTYLLFQYPATAGFAPFLGFFISAASLFMLLIGWEIPVTHHITLPAGYAVSMLVGASATGIAGVALGDALIWGLGIGMAGAFIADFWADCFYTYGDFHVDPPAMAIATLSLCTMTLFPLLGLNTAGIAVPLVIIAICLIVAVLNGTPKEKAA